MQLVRLLQQDTFPLVISLTSPLFFSPLATFSEHFSTQILNTEVERSSFLLQYYCNPSSHAELRYLGFFLKGNFNAYDSRNIIIKIFIFSALYEIFHFNFQSECHTTHNISNQRQKTYKESMQNPTTLL